MSNQPNMQAEPGAALAIHGGKPVAEAPFPPGWHGPAEIGDEEVAAVTEVLRSQNLFRYIDHDSSWCTRLEGKFTAMTGCAHALAVGGGTAALICGLTGIGIGDGDEVIVPGYTFIASASAVLICGGVPVIAEIDESLTIDPADIEKKITDRTKAIMPVHMRGIPCNMDPILDVARRHNLLVIEDTAQACGGSYKGRRLGSFGHVGCFSLQQHKVITAGEGGIVVTNNREVFERAAVRHDSAMCFWRREDTHVRPFPGENFRMNEMEGALACVQFDRLEGILARTRTVRNELYAGLADLDNIRLHKSSDPEGECGIVAALQLESSERAKEFAAALRAEGIPAGSMYDQGIPDRHIYCYWDYVMEGYGPAGRSRWHYHSGMCPNTLDILGRTITVHITQRYEPHHVRWIIEAIHKVAAAI